MKRRKFLQALLGTAAVLKSSVAKSAFWIGQLSGFQLPAGVALVPIDGGQTYYASNGFSLAATAGLDTTLFPLIVWLPGISSQTNVNIWAAAGCNAILGVTNNVDTSPSMFTYLGASTGVYFIQCVGAGKGGNPLLASAGAETIMFWTPDEPGFWNSSTQVDISTYMNGTNINSLTIPAHFMDGRPFHCIFSHPLLDSPDQLAPGGTGYPALAGGALFPGGPMTPAEILKTTVPNNDGNQRFVNITSVDDFWVATGLFDTAAYGGGALYDIYNYQTNNTAPGSFTCAVGSITFATNTAPNNVNIFFTANIDAHATNPKHQAICTLVSGSAKMQGPITAYTPGIPGSMTVNVNTLVTGAGTGPFSNWSVQAITLSPDQAQRGCRYGDATDMLRPYQSAHFPAPIFNFVENGNPGPSTNGWTFITPVQMNAAVWGCIIHGCRGIEYFNVSNNQPAGGSGATVENLGAAFYQTIQSGNTISIFDRTKATNYLVQALTPVIHSQFAEGSPGYVTVVGDNLGGSTAGFRAPYRPVTPNEFGPYTYLNGHCTVNSFNQSMVSAFEVMAKLYQGNTQTVNSITLTKNKFWIFAEYRGSQDDGSLGSNANTLLATFTIANTGATTVTRIYSDAVLGAASNGAGGTRITCGDTSQMATNDTVTLAGLTGFTIGGSSPNTTFTITVIDATHFDVPGAFSGTFTFLIGPSVGGAPTCGAGTIVAFHNITVTAGTTFTDTFTRGTDIRIYRVN